jgi:hypothetical protein
MRPAAAALVAALPALPAFACDYPGPPLHSPEARADGSGIRWAAYSDATNRYDHGVLGDTWEAAGLRVAAGPKGPCDLAVLLPDHSVFEDTGPRIADLDGDGRNEVVVVETRIDRGAALAVYGLRDDRLVKLAATANIGRTHRWLAPAGIADFDGDGRVEIAYVDRPHLRMDLVFVRFERDRLTETLRLPGLTNHRIGDTYISGGVRDCGQGPELILASKDWTRVMRVRGDRVTDLGPIAGGVLTVPPC